MSRFLQKVRTAWCASASRYAAALGLFAGAVLLRDLFTESFGTDAPYLHFYPAIIIAAWYGGLGPGLLTTALSTLAAMYSLLPPAGFAVGDPTDQLSLAVFAATGIVISSLNHRLHVTQQAQREAIATSTARAERLDAILNMTADGIIVIDAAGRIEAFNRGAADLFGYPESEVLGRNVSILMPSPHHEQHGGYLERYLRTGDPKIIGIGREVEGRRRDGSVFPMELSVGEMLIDGERKFTGIIHDLTRRVESEVRLREQAALARLGEMAAVIAHEVKNPLAGIRGAIQVFGSRMVQDGASAQILGEIVSRIDALDRMMKDLLLFARPPNPKRAPVDIVPLVKTTANLLNEDPALKHLDIQIGGTAPPVAADPDMLRIVFQNLFLNSAQAMRGKGRILVGVEMVDGNCQIAFSDGGPGIPADVREKIFTPFFTTKARGSGLGLPTVKRFVEAHNGEVDVDCPPAGGTTVVIRLPIAEAAGGQPAVV
ncbi:MAG TPA: PAS domain S-box protein [Vicinamibacterales bacterium]|nr:PAS domain S-box protein [Vicinamibacterales bacterium]